MRLHIHAISVEKWGSEKSEGVKEGGRGRSNDIIYRVQTDACVKVTSTFMECSTNSVFHIASPNQ